MTASDQPLSLGFSPCPNDTFIFNALVHNEIGSDCRLFGPEVLEDVETLNLWALEGKLDVSKISFHALGHVLDRYVLLSAGAALGRGCGPLLVAGEKIELSELAGKTVAVPGRYTTAALLLQMFAPQCGRVVQMRFDEIMPSLEAGEVDAGVIIHESRFTYHRHGLVLIQDLGSWWEKISGCPIPLGGIVARRSLGADMIRKIDYCIKESVRRAFAEPTRALPYIKEHARELETQVIDAHVDLYVNKYSLGLGQEGFAAVNEFLRRGRQAGALPKFSESVPFSCLEL